MGLFSGISKAVGGVGNLFGMGGMKSGANPFVNIGGQDFNTSYKKNKLNLNESALGQRFRSQAGEYGQELAGPQTGQIDKTYNLLMARQQPQFEQQQTNFERMMAQRGIPVGARAFGQGLQDLSEAQSKASQEAQLAAMGESRAQQEATRQNLASALSAREGLISPQATMASLAMRNSPAYEAQQQQNQAKQSRLGALMGMGASIASGGLFSDRRLKKEIEQVGAMFDGTPIYTFKYIELDGMIDPATYMGVMAQEVEDKYPDVIEEHDGYKLVNYKKLTAHIEKPVEA